MRGLTDEERACLLGNDTFDCMDPLLVALEKRGLLREGAYLGNNVLEMDITADGALALRLDSAARSIGMVPA